MVACGKSSDSTMIASSAMATPEHDISRSVLHYTPAAAWRQLAPTCLGRDECQLVVAAGALFAAGNTPQSPSRRSLERYDVRCNTWTLIFSERPKGTCFPAVGLANRIVLFGQREAGKAIDLDQKANILGRRAHFFDGIEGLQDSYGGGHVSPSEMYRDALDTEFLHCAAAASPRIHFIPLGQAV